MIARRWAGLAAAAALAAGGCEGGQTASPHSARRCLERAGYAAVERPGSELLHTTGEVDVTRGRFRAAVDQTQKFRDELNLPQPKLDLPYEEDFDRQLNYVGKFRWSFGRCD